MVEREKIYDGSAEDDLLSVDWSVADVLVGSFRNERQYQINFDQKFYHTAERNVPPDKFPVRYIALYRPKAWANAGILYYGEVTDTTLVKRKRIPVPMTVNNGEEWYYCFKVTEWKALPAPIAVKGEGVYTPKYTHLFLLKNCRQSYELFNVHSVKQYWVACRLRQLFDGVFDADNGETFVDLDERYRLRVGRGYFDVCDRDKPVLQRIRLAEAAKEPLYFFRLIVGITEKESVSKAVGKRRCRLVEWLRRKRGNKRDTHRE